MPYRRHMATVSRPAMWWESCWTCMTEPSVSRLISLEAPHPPLLLSIYPSIQSETPSLNSRRTLGMAKGQVFCVPRLTDTEEETDRQKRQKSEMTSYLSSVLSCLQPTTNHSNSFFAYRCSFWLLKKFLHCL